MRPSCSGGFPSRRAVLLGASALLLLFTLPAASPAAEIRLSSRTYLLHFERDLPGETRTFTPLYEYLSGDAGELGGRPFSFHFYGWGRQDLGDDSGSDKSTGEIGSAYLQYLHPTGNAEMRLGRFFLAEGAAAEILDGAFVKARTPLGLGLSLFGGLPVERSIIATDTGDSIYGGRLFFARSGIAEIGVTYLKEAGEFQGDDREVVGGDLWLRPGIPVELTGRAAYNLSTSAIASQRYVVRVSPVSRVDLALGYEEYSYADLFQNALNPAFLSPALDNTDEVRTLFAILDLLVADGMTVEAGIRSIRHDRDNPGDATRGELGLRYVFHDRRDAAGVSAAVVAADREENEYQEYRAFATYSPGTWRFVLDALTHRYKEAVGGSPIQDAYQVVGSAGWRALPYLKVSGDLTYTRSPQFSEDLAGLVRVALDLAANTGGGSAREEAPAPVAARTSAPAAPAMAPPAPKVAPEAPPKSSPSAPEGAPPMSGAAGPAAAAGIEAARKAPEAPAAVPAVPVKPREEKPVARAAPEAPAAAIDRLAAEIRAKVPDAVFGRQGEVLELALPADLAFDPGKAQVRSGAVRSLAAVAEILIRHPDTLVTIEGHTDATGTPGENQALSERRARSVFDLLVRNGIHALRLTMRAYGERVPVADNSTPEGRRANRRVQIKIRPDGSRKAPLGQGGQG